MELREREKQRQTARPGPTIRQLAVHLPSSFALSSLFAETFVAVRVASRGAVGKGTVNQSVVVAIATMMRVLNPKYKYHIPLLFGA